MLKYVMIISLLLTLAGFWKRNDLSYPMPLTEQLRQEPVQQPLNQAPFKVTVEDNTYTIKPQYEYEMYGLVVSFNLHDGDYGSHKRWGDHLNVADICVVWQDMAFSPYLTRFDFWNGQFTCNFQTRNDEAWSNFKPEQLANNHLISDDDYLRDKIDKVGIGDQIRVTGWLASYSGENGGERGTSTTRTDRGNGACETIYVQSFDILYDYSSIWRKLMYGAFLVFIVSLIIYFKKPFQIAQE